MTDRILLTLNAGSSSLKFATFVNRGCEPVAVARGQVSGVGTRPRFEVRDADGHALDTAVDDLGDGAGGAHAAAFEHVWGWLESHRLADRIDAVGHRVTHGGGRFITPVLVDEQVIGALEELTNLAPLHQPHNLAAMRAVADQRPGLPQIACFDTAFHAGRPAVSQRFALPRRYEERGILRYGFHGLSYAFIRQRLQRRLPDLASGRVVIAHLGSGCSMAALRDGRCIETTMAFSPLDGLPMGTRCGALDPGVLLYLQKQDGLSVDAIEELLYRQSGLLGLSGSSSDMRELQENNDPHAAQAVDYFVYHVGKQLGGLCAALGGLDLLVFTAGIGENDVLLRRRVVEHASWLGLTLDLDANAAPSDGERRISPQGAKPAVWVIPTDEECMIARDVVEVLAETGQNQPPKS